MLDELLLSACKQVQSDGQKSFQASNHQGGGQFLSFISFPVFRALLFLFSDTKINKVIRKKTPLNLQVGYRIPDELGTKDLRLTFLILSSRLLRHTK